MKIQTKSSQTRISIWLSDGSTCHTELG